VIAAALVALVPFGREFGLATFGLQMAQPLKRESVWWTKVLLLLAALAVLSVLWLIVYAMEVNPLAEPLGEIRLAIALSFALAIGSSGLWSTLVFRQVAAAFWFTIFMPLGIGAGASALGLSGNGVAVTLVTYAFLGFALAHWLFSHAQEVPWTGGIVALPGETARREAASAPALREPGTALVRKEFNLHRAALLAMVGLFALHVGAVITRRFVGLYRPPLLDFFPFLWTFLPLLVGSVSIAEERRLGTMQGHLVLPVTTRKQFLIKLGMVVLLGAVVPGC
jgi:hypothetical protein